MTTHAGSSIGGSDAAGNDHPLRRVRLDAVHMRPSEQRIDNPKVGRFDSSPAYQIKWREQLRCETGVYVERWYIQTPWGSLRLHHWLHSDDARHHHDHPWWFITLVLKGAYIDMTPNGAEMMPAGKIAFRPALHRHTVHVKKGGCWTLLLTGPKIRRWGFWVGLNRDKFKKSNKYFLEHGQHVCD